MKKLISILSVIILALPVMVFASGMESAVDLSNASLTMDYNLNANGSIASVHNLLDDTWTTYDNGRAMSTTLDGEVIACYHYENSVLVSVTDQYASQVWYTNGQKTHKTNHNGETTASYDYNAAGQLTTIIDETKDASDPTRVTTYNYDGKILTSMNSFDGDGQAQTTYFESGRQTHTVSDVTGVTTAVFSYDSDYRLSRVDSYDKNGGGYKGYTTYDSHQRADKSYDQAGNLAAETVYDGAKIFQQVSFPGGENGSTINVTQYNEYGEIEAMYTTENPGGW